MRPRLKNGPLDPLFGETPNGRVSELANLVGVARQTIRRWQKGGTVSKYWQLQLNLIALARGLDPFFPPPAPRKPNGATNKKTLLRKLAE